MHVLIFGGHECESTWLRTVIDESVKVAVRLQLLEMSSITKLNQTILNVCTGTLFRVLFRKKLAILPICDIEKNSVW